MDIKYPLSSQNFTASCFLINSKAKQRQGTMEKVIISSIAVFMLCGCHSQQPSLQLHYDENISGTPSSNTNSSSDSFQTYTVKVGDSLSKIAYMFYRDTTKWRIIQKANRDTLGETGVMIKRGQVIRIPDPNNPITSTANKSGNQSKTKATKRSMVTYTVRPGDTLSKIAHKVYGDATQWRLIHHANQNILNNDLKLENGLVLAIPLFNTNLSEITSEPKGRTKSTPEIVATVKRPQQTHKIGSASIAAVSIKTYPDHSISAVGNVTLQFAAGTVTADEITIIVDDNDAITSITCDNSTMNPTNSNVIIRGSLFKKCYHPN